MGSKRKEYAMDKKTKGEQTKENLIECAARLFLKNGYNATGINDILKEASITKGSFYFYFSSKKELAIAVSGYYKEKLEKWLFKRAEGKAWEGFVASLAEDMMNSAKDKRHYGCPLAVLGLEIAFMEPDVAEQYTESMKSLIKIFSNVLKNSGIPEERAVSLAKRAFTVYEGHLLYYRISKDIDELRLLSDELTAIYKTEKGVIDANEANN